jgi:hypothetical protein
MPYIIELPKSERKKGFVIELPKSERKKGFVIESPQDPMSAVTDQYRTDVVQYHPTDEMSTSEKYLAGIGHGMEQIPRGLGQIIGHYSQAQIDDMKRQDAALLATGAGSLGSFTGQMAVGTALPLKVPMISNPVVNRAVVGGLYGAVQPVASDESRALNTAVGAGAGVALPPMLNATGRTIAKVSNKVAPAATQALTQGVARGINALGQARSSFNAAHPILGGEIDPAALVSRLRPAPPATSPVAPIDLPNAMPNPTNPDAVKVAQEGAKRIGLNWHDLDNEVQRRMAASADEAINLGADLTPEMIARKAILESQGFTPTRAHLSGNSEDFSSENSLMLHPEGAQLRAISDQNNANLEKRILGMGTQTEALPLPEYGSQMRKTLGAEKAIAENRTGNLYGAAFNNEGTINTNADPLVAILKNPASFAVTKVDSPVRQYLKTIGKDEAFFPTAKNVQAQNAPKELTMDELKTLRQIVNSKWENVDNATQAQLGKIRGVLDVMEANPNSPAPLYNKARIARIVQGKKWEQPLIDKVFGQDKNYQGVYKIADNDLFDATIKHTSQEEFAPLWARMNQQQRDLTRSQVAKYMRDEVFSNMQLNAGANRLEQGSPAKFIRIVNNIGEDKLKTIFGQQKAGQIMLLARTWKELSSSPAGTKSNGSAPENARMFRMLINVLGDTGKRIPVLGKYIGQAAGSAEKTAQLEAESARRALNVNQSVDPMFDARSRTLGALSSLSAQRAADKAATRNAKLALPSRAGAFTLQQYINALQSQQQGGQ